MNSRKSCRTNAGKRSLSLNTLRRPTSSTLFPYTTLFRSTLRDVRRHTGGTRPRRPRRAAAVSAAAETRSEEHTSELQSHVNLVCRLLLEKKKIELRRELPKTSTGKIHRFKFAAEAEA